MKGALTMSKEYMRILWILTALAVLMTEWLAQGCTGRFRLTKNYYLDDVGVSTCGRPDIVDSPQKTDMSSHQSGPFGLSTEGLGGAYGGGEPKFKIPLEKGYDWEVTQSWGDHCETCDARGYYGGGYCAPDSSHSNSNSNALYTRYGWDFNLPDVTDAGRAVLASGDGVVKFAGWRNGWGNTVIIDHGDFDSDGVDNNVCTRYAHMLNDSIRIEEDQRICQGLKVGEIGATGGIPEMKPHLHFQFEECDTKFALPMAFDDGNDVPECIIGSDIYENGNYTALSLTNDLLLDCESNEQEPPAELPEGGWRVSECGSLYGCPLVPNCTRGMNHVFADNHQLEPLAAAAASYLYGECALDGRQGNKLEPHEDITRAESLKIALFLFDLMGDCSGSVPFEDVDSEDWYFDVIACAVLHGIVNPNADLFLPDVDVNFAEAAKVLVQSASFAGVIEVQDPDNGHFPKIPDSHWAYRYAETIYLYGGLVTDAHLYDPDQLVTRREYIIMAASLSPCFCGNVICADDCECDQENSACADPDATGTDTGGPADDPEDSETDEPEDPQDDPPDDPEDDIPDYELENEHDFAADCFVDTEDTTCENGQTVLDINCRITNYAEERLMLNDLVISLTDPYDDECVITDASLYSGNGVLAVDQDETLNSTGHYRISCTQMPEDGVLGVSYDLKERIAGEIIWYEDAIAGLIFLDQSMFAVCRNSEEPGPNPDTEPDPDPDPDPTPDPPDGQNSYNLEATCWIDYGRLGCSSVGGARFVINCAIQNLGQTTVRIRDITMSMTDPADMGLLRCTVVHDTLQVLPDGGLHADIDPRETETLPGYFDIYCEEYRGDLEVSLDIQDETDAGPVWTENAAEAVIAVQASVFPLCAETWEDIDPDCVSQACSEVGRECGFFEDRCGINHDCGVCAQGNICRDGRCEVNNGFACDPSMTYHVYTLFPGGYLEVRWSGARGVERWDFQMMDVTESYPTHLARDTSFRCEDLPVTIEAHPGPAYNGAWVNNTSYPDLIIDFWFTGPTDLTWEQVDDLMEADRPYFASRGTQNNEGDFHAVMRLPGQLEYQSPYFP